MFKVRDKITKDILIVYAVQATDDSQENYFLVYLNGFWEWLYSIDFEPVEIEELK